jgi:hypothetical protein
MIRPECLGLRATGDAMTASEPGVDGRIVGVAYMGNHTRTIVATPCGDLVVMQPHGRNGRMAEPIGEIGQEACVWWSASDAAFIGDVESTALGGIDGSA